LHHPIYHITSYHIVDVNRQNRLKVGTDKPKLKVKMQSVSDDDVRKKRLLEQPLHFELASGGERCIQTGKMLHPPVGRSTYGSLGQQPWKHGYRQLIAWQVAPEDDWCL